MPCRMCGFDGMSTWRQTAGCAAYSWCVCLLCFFWPLFWLPFCMDSCYDTEVICSRCGQVKGRIQADCCWFMWKSIKNKQGYWWLIHYQFILNHFLWISGKWIELIDWIFCFYILKKDVNFNIDSWIIIIKYKKNQ